MLAVSLRLFRIRSRKCVASLCLIACHRAFASSFPMPTIITIAVEFPEMPIAKNWITFLINHKLYTLPHWLPSPRSYTSPHVCAHVTPPTYTNTHTFYHHLSWSFYILALPWTLYFKIKYEPSTSDSTHQNPFKVRLPNEGNGVAIYCRSHQWVWPGWDWNLEMMLSSFLILLSQSISPSLHNLSVYKLQIV